MTATAEQQEQALERATQGQSLANYPAIFDGFMEKGIPEAGIKPRENVFTYNAWKRLGRQVCKGEHGVKVITWIPIDEKRDASGQVTRQAGKRCKSATVFHISQTQASGEERAEPVKPRVANHKPESQPQASADAMPAGYSEAC